MRLVGRTNARACAFSSRGGTADRRRTDRRRRAIVSPRLCRCARAWATTTTTDGEGRGRAKPLARVRRDHLRAVRDRAAEDPPQVWAARRDQALGRERRAPEAGRCVQRTDTQHNTPRAKHERRAPEGGGGAYGAPTHNTTHHAQHTSGELQKPGGAYGVHRHNTQHTTRNTRAASSRNRAVRTVHRHTTQHNTRRIREHGRALEAAR